jgi:hypothetical protein
MDAPDELTGPMNLGNPVETSVAELAQLIIELTGSRSEITLQPLPIDDPIQRCPDISQANNYSPASRIPEISVRSCRPTVASIACYIERRVHDALPVTFDRDLDFAAAYSLEPGHRRGRRTA